MKTELRPRTDTADTPDEVGDGSKWGDVVWYVRSSTPGQGRAPIRWDFEMPGGGCFTDPQWSQLLEACRHLMFSLITGAGGRPVRGSTVQAHALSLKSLIQWMGENDYVSFGELDKAAFDDYVDHLRAQRVSHPVARQHATLVTKLWRHRQALERAGFPGPTDMPFDGRSAAAIANTIAKASNGTIPPMPDDIFLRAIEVAMPFLDADAVSRVIADSNLVIRHRGASEYGYRVLRRADATLPNRSFTAKALADIKNACVVLLQGLTGLRANEVCGIKVGGIDGATGLPDCVIVKPSASGVDELFFVRGLLCKTTDSPEETDWLLGARPVGSGPSALPIPVRAICVLESVFREWRAADGITELVPSVDRENGAFCIRPHHVGTMIANLKNFFASDHVLSGHDPSTHQWRKSFAQYVVRSDSAMVPALKDHFKHVSIAMTERGYVAADPELLQLLDDAAVQNTVSMVGAMMSGRSRHRGPLADEIRETAKRLNLSLGNRSAEERVSDVEEMVRASGMRAWEVRFDGISIGDCLFRQGTGACTEGCPARWVLRAPLWSASRPDLCWECRNLVVADDQHMAFWMARLETQRRMITTTEADDDYALAMLARQRVAQCLTVLRQMGWRDATEMETNDVP